MSGQVLCLVLLIGQASPDPTAVIDAELTRSWREQQLTPAAKAGDHEFLRRASLDLIGRIPTRAEQAAYQRDPAKDRRRLLIERLLAHDDFARHWADRWTDLLLGWTAPPAERGPFYRWLEQHFAKNRSHKELAEKLLLAGGSTADNPAVHFWVRHRGEPIPEKDWKAWGQHEMFPLTGHVFRVFHGRRLGCVQCHDNPGDGDYHQADFQNMSLLFRQVRFTQKKNAVVIADDPELNKAGFGPFERRNGVRIFGQPSFYGKVWDRKEPRREFFTDRFIKHPDFARGQVNLLWASFFGHGLNRAADFDDDISDNAIEHPKIMAQLAAHFVKSSHDSKTLMRWLCNSEAYGLAGVANKTNAAPEAAVYFSRMLARPLSRRQLAESLAVALAGDDYPKRREKLRTELIAEIPPPAIPPQPHCEVAPLDQEADFPSWQTLWLMNGDVVHRELTSPQGAVGQAIKKYGASADGLKQAIPDFYAATLCRPPTKKEMERLLAPKTRQLRTGQSQAENAAFWTSYYEDIFWALINSNEFALNH